MINFKMYTGSYSACRYSLVLIPSLYMEIQNINLVYITMIKKMINLKMYTGSYSLVLIPSLYMEIQNINRVYITMIKK